MTWARSREERAPIKPKKTPRQPPAFHHTPITLHYKVIGIKSRFSATALQFRTGDAWACHLSGKSALDARTRARVSPPAHPRKPTDPPRVDLSSRHHRGTRSSGLPRRPPRPR